MKRCRVSQPAAHVIAETRQHRRGGAVMNAPLPVSAIKCQLEAIVRVALENDIMRLPIRAAFRDGPQLLERDSGKPAQIEQGSRQQGRRTW